MHILILHQYFLEKDGGGGSRFNEMAELWSQAGHQVTVISGMVHYNTGLKKPEYKGKLFYIEDYAPGVRVIRCHVSESYNKSFIGRLWGYFSFTFWGTMGGLLKAKDRYDIILSTSPPLFIGISAFILSRLKRIPFVFEVRDLWPESAIDTGVLTNGLIIKLSFWLEKWIYKKARLINVLTPAFRKTLIEQKKVDPKKVLYIPNAADFRLSDRLLSDFDPASFRSEHMLPDDKLILTYVGAHGRANNLEQVLRAAGQLRDKPVLFLLIGAGMEKPMLMEEAKKQHLDNILFIDPVPKKEVFRYIMASDVGISVLKKVDTFKTIYSNKTFDYMSCQKPVLMVIDGVSRELVEEAKCGKYAEPENTTAFVEAVNYFLLHKEQLREMGENGYEFAKTHFDRSKLAGRYIAEIETKLNGNG